MILGEKIMERRKKNGWSQEELAGKLNVSRQAVSKWESAMSVPDLDKILQLSEIFEVSTDYLLKEDKEEDYIPGNPEGVKIRKITMEEAQEFIRVRKEASVRISLGIAACILSPIPLLFLNEASESSRGVLSPGLAGGIGVGAMLFIVACAVFSFIFNGMKLEEYEFLEKEEFELCYGVAGMVKEKSEAEAASFAVKIAVGVGLCIVAVIPFLVIDELSVSSSVKTAAFALLLAGVAGGVYLMVNAGTQKGTYSQLLQVGDYTPENKEANRAVEKFAAVYWCVVTAIYVGYSLLTGDWGRSWIIWPVAGILFGAAAGFIKLNSEKH